ncbi:HYC_CC_PP family protein [Taibaiella chishuiensis]|uniref:Uncharacterized protein n=1 Tax=Taibaiella chishuiensis TaxID=1434707 RepID=A0A2P8DCM6_9BACT|nr:hypothetical protein [Taibaiella chishuiensis]PSK94966.1 hypothetical protein B0I18_1011129 [Taibaiella chishuiensis]
MRLRKLIAIPLLVLYIIAVSGTMVQIHFCGRKVSSWKINQEHAACCCKDAATMPGKSATAAVQDDDCCSSKVVTLKIAQDQNKESIQQLQLTTTDVFVPLTPQFAVPVFLGYTSEATRQVYQSNAPPGRWQDIPLYKLHTRFTYYG